MRKPGTLWSARRSSDWLRLGVYLGLLSGFALVAKSGSADEATLRVQPDLCMTTAQKPHCSLTVSIDWQAPQVADYCVKNGPPKDPAASAGKPATSVIIDCWRQAVSGTTTDQREVEQSFTYLLVQQPGNGANPLEAARAEVKVLAARSTDRRRNRQRRHVWSLL